MSETAAISLCKIDHCYSPPWWQSCICLPDDPVKTIVGREGQFFLDYGSGGPRNFQTGIQLDVAEGASWTAQDLPDASIPVISTRKSAGTVEIEETAFLLPPSANEPAPKVVRYDGFETLIGWAQPTTPCDPAFRDAAVRYPSGSHEASLEIHLHVPPYAARTIALGFCEGVHNEAGKRRLIALVEGTDAAEIDPVREFGHQTPGVRMFSAKDTDGDGRILISLKYHPDTRYADGVDRIADLRTIMLSALWSFAGEVPDEAKIVTGEANARAEVFAGAADLLLPHRRNYVLAKFRNVGSDAASIRPVLRITGLREPILRNGSLQIGAKDVVSASESITSVTELGSELSDVPVERAGIGGTGSRNWTVELRPIRIEAGAEHEVTLVLDRFPRQITPIAEALAALERTRAWWIANGPARGAVETPDPSVQAMVDSCIRNIFQARDIRNGLPSFHVGPTVYRGLFLADGAFMLELAAMLDKVSEARAGIRYLQSFELPSGGFNVIDTYYKENGLAIFALVRHAQLTVDPDWLRSNWHTIRGCVARIQTLRRQTPAGAPNEGLLPAGAFCDGGVFNNGRPFADYGNPAWCLAGLKWAADAADSIGEAEDAASWRCEYRDFREAFQRAAEKDLRDDGKGNLYVPVVQGNGDHHAPPRGQWAFCHSVYPGGIWEADDKIALGNLAMLRDAMVEGVVLDTGWMAGGLWPYFSSFFAHAQLWLGRGEQVPQILYDFANHSSPTLVWREEQKPRGHGYEEVGDMPHNWASAEFLRMLIHMLQIDRGDELHLLEGFPAEWAVAGLATRLHRIRTPFGRIDLEVNGLGGRLHLALRFLDPGHLPARIVAHRRSWGGDGVVELPVAATVEIDI